MHTFILITVLLFQPDSLTTSYKEHFKKSEITVTGFQYEEPCKSMAAKLNVQPSVRATCVKVNLEQVETMK